LFNSLFNVVRDVATVATAPTDIAASLTRTVTQPLADATKDIVESVREATDTSRTGQ
jgi:hypothetical protein